MSAKDEMLEYLWKESTVDMKRVNKCIAAVQLEAVEKVLFLSPRNLAVYITKLRKAAGKEE